MAPAKKTAVVKKTENEVVVYDYGNKAGLGWDDTDRDDFSIPWIKQLQQLSPECQEGEDEYVDGAKPGLLFHTVTKQLFTTLDVVVCKRERLYVEWIPQDQGGGFVGIHDRESEVVADAKANAADRNLVTKAGNDLIDTAQLYLGIIDGDELVDFAVMAYNITKLKPYRNMMTRMKTLKGSMNFPIFAHRHTLVCVNAKNKAGQPYKNVEINPMIDNDTSKSLLPPDHPILEQAFAFAQSVDSGERKAEQPVAETPAEDADDIM